MHGALLISTRAREVWTYEQKRRIDRMASDLRTAQVHLLLQCGNPTCPDPQMRVVPDGSSPNGRILRCGCKDRHFLTKGGAH